MTQPVLEGLTVLEFGAGSHAAALAGVLLADNGARVVKVEPPEGDRLRTDSPSAHLVFNRGKESVVADLRTTEGRERARELAAHADVLIAAFEPGVAERFGIDYASLRELNPLLVHCSINGFGSEGPYAAIKAYEGVVQAKTGLFSLGQGGQFGYRPGPVFGNAPIAGTGAGHLAASGIIAALLARRQTGHGQQLEVPLYFGAHVVDYFGLMTWLLMAGKVDLSASKPAAGGGTPRRTVVASRLNYLPCTKDGRFVFFTAMMPHQSRAVLRALGIEHILEEPRFANAPFFESAEDGQAWEDEIWNAFRTKTFAEWDPILRAEQDIAYELARTSEEGLDHPAVRDNDGVLTLDVPGIGPAEQVGPVAAFQATPARIQRAAPAVGENSGPLGGPAAVVGTGSTPEHPLAGITVVEFGYFFAMPFATQTLAALGARVIKIEDRGGDPMRFSFGAPETGAARVMEGKESLVVDLRTPEGRLLVHEVVAKADAFVNGFRSGIAERQGLDYDTLRALKPDLVYVHAAGYGEKGEFARRPLFAQCAEAIAGSLYRNAGFWLDPTLTEGMSATEIQAVFLPRLRTLVDGDSNAAMALLTGLTLALYHKQQTGEGQFVATSMVSGNMWAYADDAVRYEGKIPLPMTDPDLNGITALYRLYEAASGGWVFLAAPRQDEWEALARTVGRDDLVTDARFATAADRAANDEALATELSSVFATRKADEWEALLVPQGVACVEPYPATMSEFSATDPVLRETGLVAEVDHPTFGRIVRHGLPVRFSETPGRLAPGCVLAQHTRPILEELGYSPERIAELEEKQVVVTLPSD
jgi:crotonobetainyl-CoA:carnitine CoA-transferase CaiB-like acyl-CoA transferase